MHSVVSSPQVSYGYQTSAACTHGERYAPVSLISLRRRRLISSIIAQIFLIEGLITTVFGLLLLFFVPEDPSKSKLLSPEERALAVARIDADRFVKTDGKTEKTTWKLVWRSFNIMVGILPLLRRASVSDQPVLQTISCTVCFVIINMSFQGLSLFLPSVINTRQSRPLLSYISTC